MMGGCSPCSPWPADGGNGGTPALSRLFPRSPLFPLLFAKAEVQTRIGGLRVRFSGWPWW